MAYPQVITGPITEPLDLDEVKLHLGIADAITANDTMLRRFISTAREEAECYTNRQLVTATYQLILDNFPLFVGAVPFPYYQYTSYSYGYTGNFPRPNLGILSPADLSQEVLPNYGNISLPLPPLVTVNSVTYYDTLNNLQTWNPDQYNVVTNNSPGYIRPVGGYPATWANTSGVITINITAGYGYPEDVPSAIKTAMLMRIYNYYDNRSNYLNNDACDKAFYRLLDNYRFVGF